MRTRAKDIADLLRRDTTHIFICGLRGLEEGVEQAMTDIGRQYGIDWPSLRGEMRAGGRYHAETY